MSRALMTCLWLCLGVPLLVSGHQQSPQPHKVHPVFNDSRSRNFIRLGYLTGSQKRDGDYFYVKPGQSISGAITLAVKEVNDDPVILPNHTLQFVIAETYGAEEESIKQTVQLMRQNISAYIGPQETCVHEARIAASFNIPMISYFCTTYEVSEKRLFPTFARTKPHDSQSSMAVVSLLLKFNWRKVVFIYNDKMVFLRDTLLKVLKDYDISIMDQKSFDGPYFPDTEVSASPFVKIVHDTYQKTRVYVMLAEFFEFEGLLIALKLKGLMDTGEYIVVGVDTKVYDASDPEKYVEGVLTSRRSPDVYSAFQGFLLVAQAAPVYPAFHNFTSVVNYYLERPPFNFTNPFKDRKILKILRPEAAYLYDAVKIYARAADAAIRHGQSPGNGTAIIEYIKGTTYLSAMGYMTHIDEHGETQGNFTLLARMTAREGRKFMGQGRVQWSDKVDENPYGMYPVGTFLLNQNDTKLPQLHLKDGLKIEWIGGAPPIDEPECGFQGEKCIPGPSYTTQIVGGTIGGILFFLVVAGVILYRNWKYEQELASLLWKIDFKDISLRVHQSQYSGSGGSGLARMGGAMRASMISLCSQADLDLRQVFTSVGTYKGSIVAIKRVNKRYVDLTRSVRKELKLIREIRHDNLNAFIGACVDPGNICIITEYCTKGSLQDILGNDDFKLDNMFIASLVFDIIKGMSYLHDSEIRTHGRLKSSNCVVDSRWVLRITDYGLWEFKDGHEPEDVNEHSYYQSLLWTAPELLRDQEECRTGTQKGDVYSFAIILFELHGRCGPFGDIDLSPKEIIQRIMKSQCYDIPYRPKLSALGSSPKFVTDCIKDCWNEDPSLRPDFKTIRRLLKPMQKGMKPNIFDNMMAIMEKYATNLEEIVEERTDQLREEKKKTEELLHQMLPWTVAEQLKQGKRVEAEAFDLVTIYFSDICGFTALSSESTPMQVVDLLNDLYTTFDSIIENYDVYKVETIGDAYMVVSGLPKRNGTQHAGEIASMSIHLLKEIGKFKIRHRPSDKLKLRIGIHSGPCVAGVVGLKMPRYCLFGDTVNTASRMESTGLPLKIHTSEMTRKLLDGLGGYQIEDRGLVNMKGKGQLRTYWVVGEDNDKVKERRMSRLVPPKTTCSMKSPKTSPRHRGDRSPKLQKIASLPLLKHQDSLDKDKDVECGESDKLLNGMIPNSPLDVNNDSPSMSVSRPGLPRKTDDEWYMLTKNRRSASVKIKFNDEMIPENNVLGDFRRSDTIWENSRKEVEENLANMCTEGSPLLNCVENLDKMSSAEGGSGGNPIKTARRQSAGETRV